MSLPLLVELPDTLKAIATNNEQALRSAVSAVDGLTLDDWDAERWAAFARVSAASEFVFEQSLRDPAMLLDLAASCAASVDLSTTATTGRWVLLRSKLVRAGWPGVSTAMEGARKGAASEGAKCTVPPRKALPARRHASVTRVSCALPRFAPFVTTAVQVQA